MPTAKQLTKRQFQAAKLLHAAEQGDPRAQFYLSESVSQSDLIKQLEPTLGRRLVSAYNEVASVKEKFTSRQTVSGLNRDETFESLFFDQSLTPDRNMGERFIPGGLPRVGNRELYPQLSFQGTEKKLRVAQLGEAFGVDWQAVVNSRGRNVDMIGEAIKAFGQHATNQEDIYPVKALLNENGFRQDQIGTAGHIAGDPDLSSILTLQAAIQQAQTFKIDGVDVLFDDFALLVTPAYAPVVRQMLSQRTIRRVDSSTTSGKTTGTEIEVTIDLGATVEVVANRWLTAVYGAFGKGWILVPRNTERPVLTSNYLEGYEAPSFWVKDTNAYNYNAGPVPLLDGDFDSDAIQTKVRHANGSNVLWNEGIMWSTGANTVV